MRTRRIRAGRHEVALHTLREAPGVPLLLLHALGGSSADWDVRPEACFGNMAMAVLILVCTGNATEHLLDRRTDPSRSDPRNPRQFSLQMLFHFSVIVAVMCAAGVRDPGLGRSGLESLVWLLSAVLGFGVVCTVCTLAALAMGLYRRIRPGRDTG